MSDNMISGTEKVILYLDGLTLAGSLTLISSWSRVATSTCASCHVLLAEWCTRHVVNSKICIVVGFMAFIGNFDGLGMFVPEVEVWRCPHFSHDMFGLSC